MNPLDPHWMSASERVAEVARVVALGLVRLRAQQSVQVSDLAGEGSRHISPGRSGHPLFCGGHMVEFRARPRRSYRNGLAVPHFDDRDPMAFMDGDCVLCASGAHAIAWFDRERLFLVGRPQSALGATLVRYCGPEPEDPETRLHLEDGRAWSGMEAILRIEARSADPERMLGALRVIRRPAREWLHRRITRSRYWFGCTDMRALPDRQLRAGLIE